MSIGREGMVAKTKNVEKSVVSRSVVATGASAIVRLGGNTHVISNESVITVDNDATITGLAIINLGVVVVHGEVEANGPKSVAKETNVDGGTPGK